MSTPLDQDAVNPNFLTLLANLQTRVETLERQAATGLFDGDTMKPPGVVTIEKGNLEVVGNRSIHRSILSFGTAVVLTVVTGEITVSQTYNKVAAETGTTDSLITINGGVDGDAIILMADTGDLIGINESGNITVEGSSVTLAEDEYFLAIYNGDTGKWVGDNHVS